MDKVKQSMKDKVPEIERSLDLVRHLQERQVCYNASKPPVSCIPVKRRSEIYLEAGPTVVMLPKTIPLLTLRTRLSPGFACRTCLCFLCFVPGMCFVRDGLAEAFCRTT